MREAEKETGGKRFVKKISFPAFVYKIFPSRKKYLEYMKKKKLC